jgi:hypothetical protein
LFVQIILYQLVAVANNNFAETNCYIDHSR